MSDFGPAAFQRSGTVSPVLCSVTATSLSSRAQAGQQNDPARRTSGFWHWPHAVTARSSSAHTAPYELAPFAGYLVTPRGEYLLARLSEPGAGVVSTDTA
jgi:hypothetical protein